MRLVGLAAIVLLSIAMAAYAVVAYTAYPVGSTVHPEMKATYQVHLVGIVTHVLCSSLALLLGPWQFFGGLRRRWPTLHRLMGRVYLGLGVLPGGIAGLYMSLHAFGGGVSHVGFALLAAVWLYTGWRAFASARERDFASHRAWMIRNFALALGAVTLRAQLGAGFALGWRFQDFYPFLAWTSWVPNLLVAEWIIATGRRGAIIPRPPA